MRIGADDRIGISLPKVAVLYCADDACQVFEVYLVTDSGVRWNDFEVLKRGLAPAQKSIALDVALEFQFRVQSEGVDVAEIVHLHGMVDDQFRWEKRVDALGIAAHFYERLAHRGQIHDGRHAREVLQQDAGRHECNFFFRSAGPPTRQGLNIFWVDKAAIFEAKQIFKENAQRERKFFEFRDALFFQ